MIRTASFSKPNPHHPQRNEDALLEDKKNLLFAVFDRMGARKGGADSSQIAKENLKTLADSIKSREDLEKIIQDIHQQIRKEGSQNETPGKMGTTATCLKINPQETKGYYVHLGDSRIYQYSKNKLEKITADHDIIALTKKRGEITPKQAEKIRSKLDTSTKQSALNKKELAFFEGRNIITQALGSNQNISPHTGKISLKKDKLLILTTDGVHDNLTKKEISQDLSKNNTLNQKAKRMIGLAHQRSQEDHFRAKPDDMSIILVKKTN